MSPHPHPPNPIHFFKVILKTSLERIKIPNKFTGRYGGGLPNPVFLKPPDGKEWKVYWTKHDNGLWFEKGWKEFAIFYSLDQWHWVLFKYEGTSQFDVLILDQSALEIDYLSKDTSGLKDNIDSRSDDTIEILDEMPLNQKARPKTPLSSSTPHKKMRTATHEDVEKRSSNRLNLHMGVKTDDGQSLGTEFQKSTNAELKFCKQEPEEDMGGRIHTRGKCLNSEHLRRMKALTPLEKTKALKRANTFRSENPFFMVVMQPSYVHSECYLPIPAKIAENCLKTKYGVVQLQALDGRTWSAKYNSHRIRAGWGKFVMDNNLKVGDLCVFEMIDSLFRVYIFREAEEGNLKLNPSIQMQINSMQHTALENTSSYKSKNPYFIANMTCSYILGKLNLWPLGFEVFHALTVKEIDRNYIRNNGQASKHVPMKFAEIYFDIKNSTGSVKLLVQDGVWSVGYVRRSSGKQQVAEFSCGWKQFRKDNGLKVGDVCVFELIQRIKLTFQVTIFRATKQPVH